VAAYRWCIVGACRWYIVGACRWCIYGRILTAHCPRSVHLVRRRGGSVAAAYVDQFLGRRHAARMVHSAHESAGDVFSRPLFWRTGRAGTAARHRFGPGKIAEGVDGRASHPLPHFPGPGLHAGKWLHDHFWGCLFVVLRVGSGHYGANAADD
jgi:hypothetical protein